MEWVSKYRLERDAPLDMEACGILALKCFFAGLRVEQNYQSFLDHFFVKLPNIFITAGVVFETHEEDQDYATMRQDLERQIAMLQTALDNAAAGQLEDKIVIP